MTTATGSGTAAPRKTAAAAPRRAASPSGDTTASRASTRTLADHLGVLQEGDVMTPDGLHAFLESMRALTTGMAFFAEAASTQLEAAMRQAARDNTDGRLTLAEKARLRLTLRRVNRGIETEIKDTLLDGARGAVKTYAIMQAFLDELESSQVSRPHRSSRGGGFNLFGGS